MDHHMVLPYLPARNQGTIYPMDYISQQQQQQLQQILQPPSQQTNQLMAHTNSYTPASHNQSQTMPQIQGQSQPQNQSQTSQQQYHYSQGQYQQYTHQQYPQQYSYPYQSQLSSTLTSQTQQAPLAPPYSQYLLQFQGAGVGTGAGLTDAGSNMNGSRFLENITPYLPVPPLSKVAIRPAINLSSQKRVRRKSKFTKYQDDLIVQLKEEGKSWVEIAEISKVGSYLAARNRYQVIVGQQGNNNSNLWHSEYSVLLKKLLDKYEHEKWKFITMELNKAINKDYSIKDVQQVIASLFSQNPYSFQVNENLVHELVKEKKVTEKAFDSTKASEFDDFLNYQLQLNENSNDS